MGVSEKFIPAKPFIEVVEVPQDTKGWLMLARGTLLYLQRSIGDEKMYWDDFSVKSDCGTAYCAMGWIAIFTGTVERGEQIDWRNKRFAQMNRDSVSKLRYSNWLKIFGSSVNGTISDRLSHVDKMLADLK